MTSDAPTEYVSSGVAARMLGYADTRSVVRLLEMGELDGIRTPGGHWRIERASLDAALERFRLRAAS